MRLKASWVDKDTIFSHVQVDEVYWSTYNMCEKSLYSYILPNPQAGLKYVTPFCDGAKFVNWWLELYRTKPAFLRKEIKKQLHVDVFPIQINESESREEPLTWLCNEGTNV